MQVIEGGFPDGARGVQGAIESLGAKFVDGPYETRVKSANAPSVSWLLHGLMRQLDAAPALAVHERAPSRADIIITTRLIIQAASTDSAGAQKRCTNEAGDQWSCDLPLARPRAASCPLTVLRPRVVVGKRRHHVAAQPTVAGAGSAADASGLVYARNLL